MWYGERGGEETGVWVCLERVARQLVEEDDDVVRGVAMKRR